MFIGEYAFVLHIFNIYNVRRSFYLDVSMFRLSTGICVFVYVCLGVSLDLSKYSIEDGDYAVYFVHYYLKVCQHL